MKVRRWLGPGLVLAAAGLAIVPMLLRGDSCGHDFDFHLVSWFDALNAWGHGIVNPRWAASPNFNAGEPRFIFYPPLTWMLGGILGAVLPWTLVVPALVFLLLAGTGLATRALARLGLSDGAATLAGCVAIFSGYTLFTAYERSAIAELAGGIWMPLVLLVMLRRRVAGQPHRDLWISVLWLGPVIAGAWLSNAPVGVMSCYLLAGVALLLTVMERSLLPLVRAGLGAGLGLALAAFYILPAAYEQRWVAIRQAVDDPGEQIRNSFLFGRHANARLALHDTELRKVSWIAVGMLATIVLALLVSWARRRLPGDRRLWVTLAAIAAAVLLLMLPLSLPVWNAVPEMRFLQFPWRWLVALEAPLGIFVAAAVWGRGRVWRIAAGCACALIFAGMTAWSGYRLFQVCDPYDAVAGMLQAYGDGGGFIGTDEYAPPWADNSVVPQSLPAGCLVKDPQQTLGQGTSDDPQPDWSAEQKSCVAEFDYSRGRGWPGLHREIAGAAPQRGYLILRLRQFPAWVVRVNGRRVERMPERDDGLIAVAVPAGPLTVTEDWRDTRDVVLGRWISLGAWMLLMAGLALTWHKRKLG